MFIIQMEIQINIIPHPFYKAHILQIKIILKQLIILKNKTKIRLLIILKVQIQLLIKIRTLLRILLKNLITIKLIIIIIKIKI